LGGEALVADGVHSAVDTVQTAPRNQRLDGLGREAKDRQLPSSYHAMLTGRQVPET
jgi:hypothetical protein